MFNYNKGEGFNQGCPYSNRSKLKLQIDPKKTENHTKPNIIGCVRMILCENRSDWIEFWIDFSKPNQTESKRIHIF